MYYSNRSVESSVAPRQIVSDEATDVIFYSLFIFASTSMALFGFVANIINIVVYTYQGIKDSITVQFLAMSISDFLCSFGILMTLPSYLVAKLRPNLSLLDPLSFAYFLASPRSRTYAMSVFLMVFISIERCCSVVYPLEVKSLFTKTRSVQVIISMAVFCIVCETLSLVTMNLRWTFDPRFNSTRLILWISQDRLESVGLQFLLNSFFNGLLPTTAEVIVTFCATMIISRVQHSSQFRQSSREAISSLKERKLQTTVVGQRGDSGNKFQNRDAKLIKTVILIDLIFIACNAPRCVVSTLPIIRLYIPDFSLADSARYYNLVFVMQMFLMFFESVGCYVNFLIYYNNSAKFKATCDRLFHNKLSLFASDVPPPACT